MDTKMKDANTQANPNIGGDNQRSYPVGSLNVLPPCVFVQSFTHVTMTTRCDGTLLSKKMVRHSYVATYLREADAIRQVNWNCYQLTEPTPLDLSQ